MKEKRLLEHDQISGWLKLKEEYNWEIITWANLAIKVARETCDLREETYVNLHPNRPEEYPVPITTMSHRKREAKILTSHKNITIVILDGRPNRHVGTNTDGEPIMSKLPYDGAETILQEGDEPVEIILTIKLYVGLSS